MNCDDVIAKLDDGCDGLLTEPQQRDFEAHLDDCAQCRRLVVAEQRWRHLLARQEPPVAESGFEQRMLQAAHGQGDARRRWTTPVAGGAMAACLALGLMLGQWWPGSDSDGAIQPETTELVGPVADDQVEDVQLAFESGQQLQNVTLTLELPPHAELVSFPGERSISWQVDLEEGQNMLALPMRTLFPGEGELVAHLDDGERRKTFRAPVRADGKES